jgi:hypothetical protein
MDPQTFHSSFVRKINGLTQSLTLLWLCSGQDSQHLQLLLDGMTQITFGKDGQYHIPMLKFSQPMVPSALRKVSKGNYQTPITLHQWHHLLSFLL